VSVFGPAGYLTVSKEISRQAGLSVPLVLGRILLSKAFFGLSAFDYGLYRLGDKSIREVRQYLTKKQSTKLFDVVNPLQHRRAVDDKLLFNRLCRDKDIPTPDVLAVLSRDGMAEGALRVFPDFGTLASFYASEQRLDLILKPRSDSLGTGVRFVSFQCGRAIDIDGRPIDLQPFIDELHVDMQRDQYLVQPFLRSHPDLAGLSSGPALGTIRVLAFSDQGKCRIIYAVMRIPAAGNVHDNFSAGASGNLIAAVHPSTGKLSRAWGRKHGSSSRLLDSFARNPVTGTSIEGVQVPMWQEVHAVLSRATTAFSQLPCLGWDLAITGQSVIVIEANSNPDLFGGQACTGVGARTLLAPVIERFAAGF
jgi:glutathione synthase/RimK-type ligase-like ATP-grasp enzyme